MQDRKSQEGEEETWMEGGTPVLHKGEASLPGEGSEVETPSQEREAW